MNWQSIPLGDLCTLNIGKTPSRAEATFWRDGRHPWLSISDMNQGRDLRRTKECVTDQGIQSANMRLVAPGTLLLSYKLSIGKVGFTRIPMYTNEAIAALSELSSDIYPEYMYWALQHVDLLQGADRAAMGATLNKAKLRQVLIPVPPLPEQRRIAAILDKTDALRAKRREAIAKLDQLLQSVFLEMFGDPATNPKGWPVGTLVDLGELDRGVSRHRPRGAPELLGGKHPLIQTGDVSRSGGYIREFTATYSDTGLAQSKKWPSGTLCITIAANIAETGILTFDACFPDSVVGFTPNQTSNVEFVQELVRFLREILEERAPQVAQKNINLAILRELPIPIPPADSQHQFARVAARIEHQKRSLQHHANQLDILFASLQHRAFAGAL